MGGLLGRALQPVSNPQRSAKRHWELTTNVYRIPELAGPEIKSTNYEVNAYLTATGLQKEGFTLWANIWKAKPFLFKMGSSVSG